MSNVFTINAFTWRALLFIVVMAAFPVALVWVATRLANASKAGAFAVIILVLILPVFIGLLAQLFFVSARLRGQTLTVGGGLYSVDVPFHSIKTDQIRVHPVSEHPRLGLRTNGIGMPGLALGWFIAPGGKKVFAATTSHAPLVIVPTTLDYDIWTSPQGTEEFVERLRDRTAKTF